MRARVEKSSVLGWNKSGIIWGLILVLYIGSPDLGWNLNYKYGDMVFCCKTRSMEMDEFM